MTARPRALLFDWDNTLVDSWLVIHEALVVTFEAMGQQPWTLPETKLRVRHSLREAFPRLFGERWDEARKLYLDTFGAIHLERLTTIPGADALVARLAREGYYLAVVSNKTGRLLRREVDHLGWQVHFRRCVGAGDAGADKPDPAPVHLALEGSGIAPEASWFVGDTELDVECALASGCVPVLLGAQEEVAAVLAKAPSTLHFSDCPALLGALGHL